MGILVNHTYCSFYLLAGAGTFTGFFVFFDTKATSVPPGLLLDRQLRRVDAVEPWELERGGRREAVLRVACQEALQDLKSLLGQHRLGDALAQHVGVGLLLQFISSFRRLVANGVSKNPGQASSSGTPSTLRIVRIPWSLSP
jgi:hypothetical protein